MTLISGHDTFAATVDRSVIRRAVDAESLWYDACADWDWNRGRRPEFARLARKLAAGLDLDAISHALSDAGCYGRWARRTARRRMRQIGKVELYVAGVLVQFPEWSFAHRRQGGGAGAPLRRIHEHWSRLPWPDMCRGAGWSEIPEVAADLGGEQ